MTQTTLLCALLLLLIPSLSCVDQGSIVEYLEITELQPAPNETNVDKATLVSVHLNREVNMSEAGKMRMRYIDDTSAVRNYPGFGLTPPLVPYLLNGPFIWLPGRTVEVTIPKTISDSEGRTLREDFVYRFSIAPDSTFRLAGSMPQQGDTITLSANPYVYGMLTFSDYMILSDSVLSITPAPPATIHASLYLLVDGRDTPQRTAPFSMKNLSPGSTYEITIPAYIKDYEGETLPQDYRIVFHTRP